MRNLLRELSFQDLVLKHYKVSPDYNPNKSGRPYQYFHYSAFGEVLVQRDANYGSFQTSYTFNAKEFDAETGLGYYGARYYNPTFSVWLGVDPKAHWYPGHSPFNFSLNNPINLIDPNGKWVKGAGFWSNLFYSDKRNEAKLMAGNNGSFEKTDDGWIVTRSIENNLASGQGDFDGELLNEVEIIKLKDDGERSIDDHAANMVRGIGNAFFITATTLAMPFVALAKNKTRKDGDPYVSANPYALKEDTGWSQLEGSKQEVGKEVMKATVGTVLFGANRALKIPGEVLSDTYKRRAAKFLVEKGVEKGLEESDD